MHLGIWRSKILGKNMFSAGILGMGSEIPENVVTNYDLEKIVDTSNEWIVKRTGISERRVLNDDKPTYSLGIKASKKAIKNAGLEPTNLDLIIVATETPDYLTPSTACTIQKELGIDNIAAFDLNAACSGFVYGLTVAKQFISTGYYKHILVIGCEGLSKVTDWKDRNTCVLLADGAGAAVVGRVKDGYGILQTEIGAVGKLGHNLTIPCCYINEDDLEKRTHDKQMVLWMNGSEVLKFAVRAMERSAKKVIDQEGLNVEDIRWVVPHQANIRIIEGAMKRLKMPIEKASVTLDKYGNISSASIPIAFDEILKKNEVSSGDYIVFVGFGGGLTWGAALIRWI